MDSRSSHWSIATRRKARYYAEHISPSNIAPEYYSFRVRLTMADRVVRFLLRVAALVGGAERVESWAMADFGDRPSMGYRKALDNIMALQRERCLPNQSGRP